MIPNVDSNKSTKSLLGLILIINLIGCTATLKPVAQSKAEDFSEDKIQRWGHLDPKSDNIPGMSVDRAYSKIIKNKQGQQVIVAVLDSGIDLDHEDLQSVLWVNEGETPGNGRDDDNNGFIDDVHGYNFLGESYNEQLEATRILRLNFGDQHLQTKARLKFESEHSETLATNQQISMITNLLEAAHGSISKKLNQDTYTVQDLENIEVGDEMTAMHVDILTQVLSSGESVASVLEEMQEAKAHFQDRLNYHLNIDFNGREVVGDDPYDFNDQNYGNGNPQNRVKDESHGTHVAGIIAADRQNNVGIKGVAQNVSIMSIRAVPNGDEYDKDIALGIRYAVDNGAKVINASFGKAFSPNAEWVYEALEYAASKDVLFVHAAGNDGADLDDPENENFPNDHKKKTNPELADNIITVGALTPFLNEGMIASFSNYGANSVDIFAPGDQIYSTMPENEYKAQGGTSMAAPAVAGLAAMIWSYYPELTSSQIKQIIMQSGLTPDFKVTLASDPSTEFTLDQISRSGKIANAYEAMKMARKVSRGRLSLH